MRGFGILYGAATRNLIVGIWPFVFEIHWPTVGACTQCGHGHKVHAAWRSGNDILWKCKHHGCTCRQYTPETK